MNISAKITYFNGNSASCTEFWKYIFLLQILWTEVKILYKYGVWSGAKACKSCRSWTLPQNEYKTIYFRGTRWLYLFMRPRWLLSGPAITSTARCPPFSIYYSKVETITVDRSVELNLLQNFSCDLDCERISNKGLAPTSVCNAMLLTCRWSLKFSWL